MRKAVIVALAVPLALVLGIAAPEVALAQRNGAAANAATTFWEVLGDTTLERLVAEALARSPGLRAAEARLRGTRAERTDAALDLAPAITATGGYSRQRFARATVPGGALPGGGAPGAGGGPPDQGFWEAGVQAYWELDLFGRGRRTLEGRSRLAASAEEELRDLQLLLGAEVARAYFELRGIQDRLAVARKNAENQHRTLELTCDRLNVGTGTALDTERAQTQLTTTLAVIPALEAGIRAAQHRIGVLLGAAPGAVVKALDNTSATLALPPAEGIAAPAELVLQRPDVLGAERALAAHTAFVAAARAEYLPRLTIGAAAGYTASRFESLGSSGSPRYVIGPVVSWPLFDLGRVKTRIDAARAGQAEAAARYEQATLRAREELETSLVVYQKARERLEYLEAAAAASERATELARLRFEEGAAGFLEVLDAERTQLDAQDRLAAGHAAATAALVVLYRARGGEWRGRAAGE
jgi:NodT family efflux transporter outer membrane factor (OMF) lipoprotein